MAQEEPEPTETQDDETLNETTDVTSDKDSDDKTFHPEEHDGDIEIAE